MYRSIKTKLSYAYHSLNNMSQYELFMFFPYILLYSTHTVLII